MWLGKVAVTQGCVSLCPVIAPSHACSPTCDLPEPGPVSNQDTSLKFIRNGDTCGCLCAQTHSTHTCLHACIQALLFWVRMHLTCASMHSFTSQAYSSLSPGNYGNDDYI